MKSFSDLEQFYPDRMASRILGMGDVMSLIEKAQANLDETKAKEMEKKASESPVWFRRLSGKHEPDEKNGRYIQRAGMIPGLGGKMKDLEGMIDEKDMARKEAIIYSMTPAERSNPDLLNPSRKARIARGAGVDMAEVNRFVKQFEQTPENDETDAWAGKRKKRQIRRFQIPVLTGNLFSNRHFTQGGEKEMAVKIRLRRMGQKKAPYYRIVVADARSPRDEDLSRKSVPTTPTRSPALYSVDEEAAKRWLANGAQPTEVVGKISNWPAFRSKAAAEVS